MNEKGAVVRIIVNSTIYIKGGSEEERKKYIDAANDYLVNHNNFDDAKSSVNLTFDIKYKDGTGRSTRNLKEGENMFDIAGGSAATGRWDEISKQYVTGVYGHIQKGMIDEELMGNTIFHESLHLLGLTDRYDEVGYKKDKDGDGLKDRKTKPHDGFIFDMMGAFHYGKWQKFSNVHRKNYRNYLETIRKTKPELIRQTRQNEYQFLLKYRVDLDANQELITPK